MIKTQAQHKEQFMKDIEKANFKVTEEHFEGKFQCTPPGYPIPHTYKIFQISPRARKWHIVARDSAGGTEVKFNKEVLNFIGSVAPTNLGDF